MSLLRSFFLGSFQSENVRGFGTFLTIRIFASWKHLALFECILQPFFSRLFLLSVMIFISVLFESVCRLINFSTHDETVSMRECIKGGK